MKELILEEARHAGYEFARGAPATCTNTKFDTEVLQDALMTGHITPDELAETFVTSVLGTLGLENNVEQRREDKIDALLPVLRELFMKAGVPKTQTTLRKAAEKLVEAVTRRTSDAAR